MTIDDGREEWHETLVSMSSEMFLALITAHLGKIKTPYNKQRLIEQLESFLRNEERQKAITDGLNEIDIAIITAIFFTASPRLSNLHDMLQECYRPIELSSRITRLENILAIYKKDGVYHITPPLLSAFTPLIDLHYIVRIGAEEENKAGGDKKEDTAYSTGGGGRSALQKVKIEDEAHPVTEAEMAALIAFVTAHKKVCKKNGTFSTVAARDDAASFQYSGRRQEVLLRSMINLNLAVEGENATAFNTAALKAFAALPPKHRAALLCAAYTVPSKNADTIRGIAQLLLHCEATAGTYPITQSSIRAIIILLLSKYSRGEIDGTFAPPSRYDKLLAASRQDALRGKGRLGGEYSNAEVPYADVLEIFDEVLDCAMCMGFIGKADGKYIFHFDDGDTYKSNTATASPLVSVDASFTVTVMPGMRLDAMLELVPFLSLVSCQTASQYSITKESATRAYDANLTPDGIVAVLREYTGTEVSESLAVSLESWYESYKAATLYRGYVLSLKESAARRFEHSPDYDKCVYKKLSEGVYLLRIQSMPLAASDNEAISTLSHAGFKYIETVRSVKSDVEIWQDSRRRTLPSLTDGKSIFSLIQ